MNMLDDGDNFVFVTAVLSNQSEFRIHSSNASLDTPGPNKAHTPSFDATGCGAKQFKANAEAAGVDGETVEKIEEYGLAFAFRLVYSGANCEM